MSRELHLFAVWSLAILVAAVAVILYQHASHTSAILGLVSNSMAGMSPAPNISSNPDVQGVGSRATGLWTPLGPISAATGALASPFPYQPDANSSAF